MGQSSTDYKQLRRELNSGQHLRSGLCPLPSTQPAPSLHPFPLSCLFSPSFSKYISSFPVIIIILPVIHFKDPLSYSLSNALANKNLFGLNNPYEIGEAPPLYKGEPEGLGICWKPHSHGLLFCLWLLMFLSSWTFDVNFDFIRILR